MLIAMPTGGSTGTTVTMTSTETTGSGTTEMTETAMMIDDERTEMMTGGVKTATTTEMIEGMIGTMTS